MINSIQHFSEEQIQRLFPFYMELDSNLCVLGCGKSLSKICPELAGRGLLEIFRINRPFQEICDFKSIAAQSKDLFILECKKDPELILRGGFEYIPDLQQLIFLGNPWFNSVEEMTGRGISLNDFAIYDVVPDMMMLIKTMQNANADTKHMVEELIMRKEALMKISSIVENYPHPVVICGTNRRISWVNEAFTKETGYQKAEVMNKYPISFLYGNHPDLKLVNEIDRLYMQGKGFSYELVTEDRHHHEFWINLQGHCLKDAKGNTLQYFFVQQNISRQKEAESRIIETLQKEIMLGEMKSRFVAMASHEFRTPMTSIKLQSELISMYLDKFKVSGREQIQVHLDTIEGEIDRLTRLIGDILLLGKIEQSEKLLDKNPIDIEAAIREEIDRQIGMSEKDIKIPFTIKGKPVPVALDADKFSHILDNLISNAIKYSGKHASAEVALVFEENRFILTVQDFGIGIPQADQPRIFEPFFRAANALNLKGTGIGMTIVKNFVELHGGTIHFTSEENKGSSFIVAIPY